MDLAASDGGLPTAAQLARELAERAGLAATGARPLPLPEAAERYRFKAGYQSLISYVAERIDQPRYEPLSIHRLIAALPVQQIMTTAWDTLLENALRQAQRPYTKIVVDSEVPFISEDKVSLIKLHGSIEQKESLIITGDDYYDVLGRRPVIANLVRHLFSTMTVLFIGFDLDGEDFKQLYLGLARHLDRHMRRAYALQPDPDPYTRQYWAEKEVQLIAAQPAPFLELLGGKPARAPGASPPSAPVAPAPAAPKPAGGREALIQLTEVLTARFSKEELQTLCFHLGIDYDDLAGEGKAARARELVVYLEQRRRIPDLLRHGRRLRPDIDWDGLA
jgi:hypothetical protein